MGMKRILAALTVMMINVNVTVQTILADFEDSPDRMEPVLTDPAPEKRTAPEAAA